MGRPPIGSGRYGQDVTGQKDWWLGPGSPLGLGMRVPLTEGHRSEPGMTLSLRRRFHSRRVRGKRNRPIRSLTSHLRFDFFGARVPTLPINGKLFELCAGFQFISKPNGLCSSSCPCVS
jgi:hypothetical protein